MHCLKLNMFFSTTKEISRSLAISHLRQNFRGCRSCENGKQRTVHSLFHNRFSSHTTNSLNSMESQSLVVLIFLWMASCIYGNPYSPSTAIYYPEQTPTHIGGYNPLPQPTEICPIPDSYNMTDSPPGPYESNTPIEYNTSSVVFYTPRFTEMVTSYSTTTSGAWSSTHTQTTTSAYSSAVAQDRSLASPSVEMRWIVWLLSMMIAGIGVGIAL